MISWWATIPNTGFPISEWHSHSYHAPWFVPPTQPTYHYSNLERRFHITIPQSSDMNPSQGTQRIAPLETLVEVMHLLSDHFLRASPAKGIREFAGVNCGCYFITPRHLVQPPKKTYERASVHFFLGWGGRQLLWCWGGLVDILYSWIGERVAIPWNWLLPRQPHLFWPEPQGYLNDGCLFRPPRLTKKRFDSFWDHLKLGSFTGWSREHQKSGWKDCVTTFLLMSI